MEENILRWVGGKSDLFKFLQKYFPPHKRYVEVFMGGGNVFNRKELADINIVNDLNGNLINMYKVINDPIKHETLKQLFKHCVYGREMFDYFKWIYKNTNEWANKESVVKAFMYIYLNKCSFNGQFDSYAKREDSSTLYIPGPTIDKMFNKFQAGKTVFEKLPFEELLVDKDSLNKYWELKEKEKDKPEKTSLMDYLSKGNKLNYDLDSTFIYLDPPYWVTTLPGNKYYEKLMIQSEHFMLRDILVNYKKAKWLMSYDDVPDVRNLYGIPINNDSLELQSTKFPSINAILTPEVYQSSNSTADVQLFKREICIANYKLSTQNTLFE